ncbi:hypothetical protein S40293_02256 [Stachybotrys chartarum IBT 40293]|nr:hypothetical protein S40293_02256 [Stachybotrys chartarum IBT 40293]
MFDTTNIAYLVCLFILPGLMLLVRPTRHDKTAQPPQLPETIPFLSNGWLFMTDKRRFLSRARQAFKTSPVVKYRLGPLNVHLITGADQVSTIFRSSFTSEPWVLRIIQNSAGLGGHDLEKFKADESGGALQPRHGMQIPKEKRVWYGMHHVYDDSLLTAQSAEAFARDFQSKFWEYLSRFPVGESAEIKLLDFLRESITTAATQAVIGKQVLDINPGFVDAFWQYEKHVEKLAFGLPGWFNKPAIQARERFRKMLTKWFESIKNNIDYETVASEEADQIPLFASRVSRNLAHWTNSFNFSSDNVGAIYALFLFGLHANTVPVSCWLMMELINDPELFRAVQEELAGVCSAGAAGPKINVQKLMMLPLMQSIYTEVLRLHVDVLITRTATEPVTVAGYHLPKGTILQAPTEIAHLDEELWGTPGHPASEFWAKRHTKEVEVVDEAGVNRRQLQYSMAGRTGSFFPYVSPLGGGFSICAGRNFAKHEVFLAIAVMITSFEIESFRWVNLDGSPTDRKARNDTGYANTVAAPPDRDMKITWRRVL